MKNILLIGLALVISLPALSDTSESGAYQFWLQPSLGIQDAGVGAKVKARYISSDRIYALEVGRGTGLFTADEGRHVSLTTGKLWEKGFLKLTAEAGIAYVDFTEDPNEPRFLSTSSEPIKPLKEYSGVGIPLILGAYINSSYIGIGLSTGAILTPEGTVGMFSIDIPFGKLKY